MLVNQIAVFLENKKGTLNGLMQTLADNNVNVKSLNIADTSDFGIVRLVTDDNDYAVKVIKENNYIVKTNDLLGIEVEDKPGMLSKTLELMAANGVEIEYIYSYTLANGKTLILVKPDDMEKAQALVK